MRFFSINFSQPPYTLILKELTVDELRLYVLTILMVVVVILMKHKIESCLPKGNPRVNQKSNRLCRKRILP